MAQARLSGFRSSSVVWQFVLVLLTSATLLAMAAPIAFDIKPQELGPALRTFAVQANLQVFYSEDIVAGLKTDGVQGKFEIEPALTQLLKGSELGFERPDPKTIVIVRTKGKGAEGPAGSYSDSVIVTAGKREQEVREVPGTVTPITKEVLDKQGSQSFADYLPTVPGVTFNETTPGASQVTIRGVGTTVFIDQGQQTTGYYINDLPMTEPYFSVGLPDLDTFDVDRVEVLRGPQGTLFGSATLGGAINYIPSRPRFGVLESRLEFSPVVTANGDGSDYAVKAMANVPLAGDTLALRAVGTYRKDAGYLDNVGVGVKGSNEMTTYGGRVMLDWRASDNFNLSLFGLYNRIDNKDGSAAYPAAGELKRDTKILEPFRLDTKVLALKGEYFWPGVTLTVNVAHTDKEQNQEADLTAALSPLFGGLLPVVSFPTIATAKGDIFEARLTSLSGRKVEWLLAASYSQFKQNTIIEPYAEGAADAIEQTWAPYFGEGVGELTAPGDVWAVFHNPLDGKEKAVFGEITFRPSERWRVTAGGRYYDTRIEADQFQSGFLTFISSGQLSVEYNQPQHETGFTPKFAVSYAPSKNATFYALVSRGFRFGGVNLAPPNPQYPSPQTFDSDRLTNYELGARLAWQSVTLDVTPYYIDWQDIQLNQVRPDFQTYADNVGRARNIGVDVVLHAKPSPRFGLDAALGYLDATLRDDVTASGMPIPAGATLPGASKWTGSLSGNWNFGGAWSPALTASYRYVSTAPANLQDTVEKGGYSLIDLRGRFVVGGVRWELFCNNLLDERGVTAATEFPNTRYYVRPRNVGLRMVLDLR